MDVDNAAVSGPDTGNTGSADPLDSALDKALNAAFGGADGEGGDLPPQMVQAKQEADRKAKTTDAGDKSDGENATAAPGKAAKASDAGAAPPGNAPEAIEAPTHWPEDRRKAFASWPKEVQQHALAVDKDLQGGFTRKSQELSDQVRYAETVRGLFGDHHRQQLQQAGLDEVGAVRYLLQLQDYATRDPVGYARWFMQQYGMTPEHLGYSPTARQPAQPQQQQQPAAYPSTGDPKLDALLVDPAVAQLRTEFGQFSQAAQQTIGALQAKLDAQERAAAQAQQARQIAHVNGLRSTWDKFRSSQDDTGQLKYPHADALAKQIGAIMETDPEIAQMPDGPAKLDAAYAAALWARPNLRTSLIEQERARATAEAQKAAEAKRAANVSRVKPATGAPTTSAKKRGLDGALEDAFTKHGM